MSGSPMPNSSRPNEIEIIGGCRDFKAPLEYPFAWRNESVVESYHGDLVGYSALIQ